MKWEAEQRRRQLAVLMAVRRSPHSLLQNQFKAIGSKFDARAHTHIAYTPCCLSPAPLSLSLPSLSLRLLSVFFVRLLINFAYVGRKY